MKPNGAAKTRQNASVAWQNRVGKNSSFAEAVYHAWLGIVCVWSTSVSFKLIVAGSVGAITALIVLHVDPIYISVTTMAASMAVGAALIVNAFARLIKLAYGVRS